MEYNHKKLRGLIKEKVGSEYKMAEKMGISQATLSAKLNNKIDFSRTEIIIMTEILDLSENEFKDVFFKKIVCKLQTKY